ncbi:plasmid mobilization relaxosome protein MobC [Sphingobium sp. DEHP117]|uniref:plasmid mobilization protein n=1 Tax=Sphingobium sp. DEHP117 TaxID=2993436 RepID=UPI0027D6D632|nr:plasmid mobilization relaxosome protein MobC [Sphingobium sp. DEHP117]MDQ4421221.1 plasmid mobilization relaxosome protein MobC [Sphingobium sp. DEHP117]
MERVPPTKHISFRVTFAEAAHIKAKAEAASIPVSDHIRSRMLDDENARATPRRRSKNPVKDHKALAQAIGLLGQSRISSNLNQLARAANTGSLPVTPDTEAALLEALDEIHEIRRLLIAALNLEVEP